jgi:hypothetical protein
MTNSDFEQKLIAAYDRMTERVHEFIHDAEEQTLPTLQRALDKARQQAIELKELSSDEAAQIAEWFRRDMMDAAAQLKSNGKEFSDWLSFDTSLVEERALELFAKVADNTRLELDQLAQQAEHAGEYHTGQVTGIGTLVCESCGKAVHFNKTSRIPPCPACSASVFKRPDA